MPRQLAVYGSLVRAEGMLKRLGADTMLRFVGEARISGRLFDLGEYPGLIVEGMDSAALTRAREGQVPLLAGGPSPIAPAVPCELFEVLDASVLTILDDYEGFDPGNPAESPFIRCSVRLLEPILDAWVYVYSGSVQDRPEVKGMGWSAYKSVRPR